MSRFGKERSLTEVRLGNVLGEEVIPQVIPPLLQHLTQRQRLKAPLPLQSLAARDLKVPGFYVPGASLHQMRNRVQMLLAVLGFAGLVALALAFA